MSKAALTLLIATLACGLILQSLFAFSWGQTSTSVKGIIYADTIWTKANSPYSVTGPLSIFQGITLTIEPGVTVNFNSYYMQVNGTLRAIGTSTDPITLNGNPNSASNGIMITQVSNGWNNYTGTGNTIQFAIIIAAVTSEVGIKFSDCTINGYLTIQGSSVLTRNIANQEVSVSGASVVRNNTFTNLLIATGTTVVENNTLSGGIKTGGTSRIVNNLITNIGARSGTGVNCKGNSLVANNIVSGWNIGVNVGSEFFQEGGTPTIENNQITNNNYGVSIGIFIRGWVGTNIPLVRNNTISDNVIGIAAGWSTQEPEHGTPLPTIVYNNIQRNANYSFTWAATIDINVTLNWWGNADIQAINQTIHDFKDDFTLGNVNFIPFLMSPNPQATIRSSSDSNVPLKPTSVTIAPSSNIIRLGDVVTFSGSISGFAGKASLTFLAIDPNGNVQTIGYAVLIDPYNFLISWAPPIEGSYKITVNLLQDELYEASQATTNLTVTASAASPSTTPTPSLTPATTPTPSLTTATTPTVSSSQAIPELNSALALLAVTVTTIVLLIVVLMKKKF